MHPIFQSLPFKYTLTQKKTNLSRQKGDETHYGGHGQTLMQEEVYACLYEALQDIVYIRLPPGINFGISLKRSEITEMGCFWSPLDS